MHYLGIISPPVTETADRNYTVNTLCHWTLVNTSPVNSTFVLNTPEYYMESPYNDLYCRYDWVQVSSGGGDIDTWSYPRQCGRTQSPYIVATPFSETSVVFKSDGSITDRGFNMSYSLSPCGGVLEGPVAMVTSPNYPLNYPDNVNCFWLLKFTEGSQIEIKTASFSLDSDCSADNVTIRNGGAPDSPVLWSGCGNQVPPEHMSQSNMVTIQFVSDRRTNAAGFNISAVEHTAGCGGLLHGMSGRIQSPRNSGETKVGQKVTLILATFGKQSIYISLCSIQMEWSVFGRFWHILDTLPGYSSLVDLIWS